MRRPRLTYANVVSSLALFIALGGTSYAVTQLPRNSVGNRQLKSNAVTSAKIRAKAVQRSDLSPSARTGSRGARGPVGPSGAAGATGPSETIQVKRPGAVEIPAQAGGSVQLAAVTLPAGSWILDATATVVYSAGGAVSDYFECSVQTPTTELFRNLLRVGNEPGAVLGGAIPVRAAATFSETTQVRLVCLHGTVPIPARAERANLIATRTGALEER